MNKPKIAIGIDPGVHTGISIWDSSEKKFLSIQTVKIHEAMEIVKAAKLQNGEIMVIYEDARKRKFDPGLTDEKRQGAGSIKRDCKIWEDFLSAIKVQSKNPAPNGKLNELAGPKKLNIWQQNMKWTKQTSEHARVSALLVWQF